MPPGHAPPTRLARVPGLAVLVLWGYVLVLLGVEHARLDDVKFDDAWIHLRYADNLAHGLGLVFQAGERVLGMGGIGWSLVLGGASRLSGVGDISHLASALNFGLLCATSLVLWRALRGVVHPVAAALVAVAVVVRGPLPASSIGGMETTLLCLLYALAFRALLADDFIVAGALAGAAFCVRIESVFLLAAAVLAALFHRPRAALPTAVAAALLPLASLAWSRWYYGVFVATSTLAKRRVFEASAGEALIRSEAGLQQALDFLRWLPPDAPPWALHLGLVPWLGLAAAGWWTLRRRRPAAAWVALQPLGAFLFYVAVRAHVFPWYLCTFVPLATVLALVGAAGLASRLPLGPVAAREAGAVALVMLGCMPFAETWRLASGGGFEARYPYLAANSRTVQYRRIAAWLGPRGRDGDRTCLAEVGAFGFGYPGRILDGLGLVSPEVLPYHPLPAALRGGGNIGAIPPGVVRDFRPEFVVAMETFAAPLLADSWFAEHYGAVGCFPVVDAPGAGDATLWGARHIYAFRRADVPWRDADMVPCPE